MIKETKKAPIIRFREFTDDWEQRKFDEIASRESSTGMSSEILPSVEYEDVISEVGQLNKDIAEKAVHKKGIKFDKIHVLYGKLRPYLHNWINPRFKGIAVGDWWVLKPVATDKDFLYRLIQTKQFDDIANLSTGSKMPRADWNLVSKSEFMIPGELKEQYLIGQCFSNLDNLITLHQRKLDQLKTLKKYFLQNMFTAKGEKVPRIRFKGFTGDWEQHKVIDLLNLLTDFDANGSFADMAKNVNTFDGSGFAWYVRMTDLENPKPLDKLKYVDKLSYDFLRKTHLYGGELLMAKRGNIGEIYIFEPRTEYATVAPNMYLLKLNEMVIPRFLYTFFISDEGQRQLIRLNASTTMGALYKDDVKNINVIMPKIGEQKKIAEHFSNLEYIITLHQRKLDQLQTMKKFMLQNMFI